MARRGRAWLGMVGAARALSEPSWASPSPAKPRRALRLIEPGDELEVLESSDDGLWRKVEACGHREAGWIRACHLSTSPLPRGASGWRIAPSAVQGPRPATNSWSVVQNEGAPVAGVGAWGGCGQGAQGGPRDPMVYVWCVCVCEARVSVVRACVARVRVCMCARASQASSRWCTRRKTSKSLGPLAA